MQTEKKTFTPAEIEQLILTINTWVQTLNVIKTEKIDLHPIDADPTDAGFVKPQLLPFRDRDHVFGKLRTDE